MFPDEFIRLAEHSGIIVPLGQFVLDQALRFTKRWQGMLDCDFRIAVNVSPRQFRDPGFVDIVHTKIVTSGVRPKSLELEITEGVLMSGHAYIDDALKRLDEMGIELAMDDFGTGYSSLSYLRRYPFHVLKIDRSFINYIELDQSDLELVNATIALAHGLGLRVVAEGVENEQQSQLLNAKACGLAQGYLFSRPIAPEAFEDLLAQQTVQAKDKSPFALASFKSEIH